MKMSWTTAALGVAVGLIAVWTVGSYAVVAKTERLIFTVESRREGYEIRRYASYLSAETALLTDDTAARSAGFKILAGYIFGGNVSQARIAMTSPVLMAPKNSSMVIERTGPVMIEPGSAGKGTMAFSMPFSFRTIADLPQPNDPRVTLREIPARRLAALTFSWYGTPGRIEEKSNELLRSLSRDGLKVSGKPFHAAYDPPFSAPYMQTHDILVELAD